MSTEERWNRSPDVAVTVNGAFTFVLNLAAHSAQPVLLDGTAQDVWDLVDGRTTDQIIERLSIRYGVTTAEINAPVREFLAHLFELALISR